VRDQYYATVRPMHIEHVEPSKRWADLMCPKVATTVSRSAGCRAAHRDLEAARPTGASVLRA